MTKLSSSKNVKNIILASSFLIAPTLAFSNESYEDQGRTDEQLQMMQEFAATEGEFSTYSVEPKSQQGFQTLKGEWSISYNYNGAQTDKIVIDDTYTADDGEIISMGSYYPDQTGGEIPIMCLDTDSVYTCVSLPPAGVDYVGFLFTISGYNIDKGFFSTASSIEGVFDGFGSQLPITGSRVDIIVDEPETITPDPITAGPENSDATFDTTSNEMTIPVLNYKDTKFKVILSLVRADEEKVIFELKDVQKISTSSVFSTSPKQSKVSNPFVTPETSPTSTNEASFDDVSGEMTIPVLHLNGSKLSLVLILRDSGTGKPLFELIELEQL